jgi:oxygen-independent coproporphyrinogen-3 oxidase
MKDIDNIFSSRVDDYLYNTSYPLLPKLWQDHKVHTSLSFKEEKDYSWYIHIPFCKTLCKFCEYTRFKIMDPETERQYIQILWDDIARFINENKNESAVLHGFDIGGGTPTSLSHKSLSNLIILVNKHSDFISLSDDFCGSIEGSFNTIDEDKIKIIADAGRYINRMSFGLQASSHLMASLNRNNGSKRHMVQVFDWCRKYGIKILNIDLMYGFSNQTEKDIVSVINIVKELMPEHLTLYEYRTNMLKGATPADIETRYLQYNQLFNHITNLRYSGHFGGNTFSLIGDDGLSSYLRHRMIENGTYKGFGISAQSKNRSGLSYNIGKRGENLTDCMKLGTFETGGDTYLLPPNEMLAKYIAISGYYGKFRLSKMTEILGVDARISFAKEFDYLLIKDMITINNDWVTITNKGFKYYGAVLSLFYPNV